MKRRYFQKLSLSNFHNSHKYLKKEFFLSTTIEYDAYCTISLLVLATTVKPADSFDSSGTKDLFNEARELRKNTNPSSEIEQIQMFAQDNIKFCRGETVCAKIASNIFPISNDAQLEFSTF